MHTADTQTDRERDASTLSPWYDERASEAEVWGSEVSMCLPIELNQRGCVCVCVCDTWDEKNMDLCLEDKLI